MDMEYSYQVTMLYLLLLLHFLRSSSAPIPASAKVLPEYIYLPRGRNTTLAARCEVTGGSPVWRANGQEVLHNSSDHTIYPSQKSYKIEIYIAADKPINNVSCSVLDFDGFLTLTTEKRMIEYYGCPDKVEDIAICQTTVSWTRPTNMVNKEIHLEYEVTIKNLLSGHIITNNTSDESFDIYMMPECFDIAVIASNQAGRSELSHFTNSSLCDEVATKSVDEDNIGELSTSADDAQEDLSGSAISTGSYPGLCMCVTALCLTMNRYYMY